MRRLALWLEPCPAASTLRGDHLLCCASTAPQPLPPPHRICIWKTRTDPARIVVLCYAFLQLTLALVYIANTSALPLPLRPASLAVHGFCAASCPVSSPAQSALPLPTYHLLPRVLQPPMSPHSP